MAGEDAAAELDALVAECRSTATRAHRRGKLYYLFGYGIMIVSLAGSIGAGALALATDEGRTVIGIVALVPAFCAMVAGQLRLVEKSNWFYRRQREMDALARRVAVATKRAPDVDTLEACYAELAALDRAMGEDWSEKLAFDFAARGRSEAG